MKFYDFKARKMNGQEVSMEDYKGKVVLVVNTASKCGLTPQFEELEALYKEYKDQGLKIIAVPSNQFGEQEPGSNEEVQSFCKLNFGVTFPVMAKADVRGENVIDLFKYLTKEQGFKGFPDSELTDMLTGHLNAIDPNYLKDDQVKWNFTKFVVDRKGNVVARFEPMAEPAEMEECIKSLL